MKVEVHSGLWDEVFLWLTPGDVIFSCQCPISRVQVSMASHQNVLSFAVGTFMAP